MLRLLALAATVCYIQAATIRTGESCPLFCPTVFNPRCGNDGVTYQNDCEFHKAECRDKTLVLSHTGGCSTRPPTTLFTVFYCTTPWCLPTDMPVCGTDNITYRNECELNNAMCYNRSLQVLHRRRCAGHSAF